MKASTLLAAAATCCFSLAITLTAQERGQWRAASTTAKGVTGDVGFTETKITLNFNAFTLAQIRTLTPEEVNTLFHQNAAPTSGDGNLFRTDIPGEKRFLHKNTLCGSENVQWIATFVNGRSLTMALFSGNDMPKFTAEDLANTTALCGTFSYLR